jgi:hypothetical protein
VAAELDVRLSSNVTSIVRGGAGAPVRITVNSGETYDFDDVIFLGAARDGFVVHEPHRRRGLALFSQVRAERYDVSLFHATGLTPNQSLFLYGNANPSRINHVDAWAKRTGRATDSSGLGGLLPPRLDRGAARGLYSKLEALQGDNHAYDVGGTLSFETVEHSARYAQSLVKAHFLPALV